MKRILTLTLAIIVTGMLCSCGARDGAQLTQSQLEQMAIEELTNKYGVQFELDPVDTNFEDDEVDGYAHVVGQPDEQCYFRMDAHRLLDNFSINKYRDDIIALVYEGMPAGLLHPGSAPADTISVGYRISKKPLKDGIEPGKLLYDPDCEIFFEPQVDFRRNCADYVDTVRQWMEFLYGLDYKWYFELHTLDGHVLFTLDPGDNGFSSADDWDDETIESYIESNVRQW